MAMLLPAVRGVQEERQAQAAEKRAAQALLDGQDAPLPPGDSAEDDPIEIDIDASQTASPEEPARPASDAMLMTLPWPRSAMPLTTTW